MRSFAQCVLPSWNRRGGRAAKNYRRRHPLRGTDGVVSLDQSRMTTPSALPKDASHLFLDAQTLLLFQEGTSRPHEGGKQW